jgi:hypothetical protein
MMDYDLFVLNQNLQNDRIFKIIFNGVFIT